MLWTIIASDLFVQTVSKQTVASWFHICLPLSTFTCDSFACRVSQCPWCYTTMKLFLHLSLSLPLFFCGLHTYCIETWQYTWNGDRFREAEEEGNLHLTLALTMKHPLKKKKKKIQMSTEDNPPRGPTYTFPSQTDWHDSWYRDLTEPWQQSISVRCEV